MKQIGVTKGMRGWFAMLYDNDGPIQTGIGSYPDASGAKVEACEWAQSEGLMVDFEHQILEPLPRRIMQ